MALAIDLAQASSILGVASSIALILTTLFVVLQLRQNVKLTGAQVRQTRSTIAFSIAEKLTHESFARRQSRTDENVKKYSQIKWQGVRRHARRLQTPRFCLDVRALGATRESGDRRSGIAEECAEVYRGQ